MAIPTLALERLVDLVAARFDDETAFVSILESANFSGSAALSGAPLATSEVIVKFVHGGEVGVAADIAYEVSVDDGVTFGADQTLTGNTVTVLGVTATLSGTIADNDYLRWQTTSPAKPVFAFGSREPFKRGDLLKISYVPGDEEDAGEIVQAKQPGRNPRPLHTFNERVTVFVEAADVSVFEDGTSNAENERAQWRAARLLMNAWVRAVYLAATCTYRFDRVEVIKPERSNRRHGFGFKLVLVLEEMIPDAAFTTAPVNTRASLLTKMGSDPDAPIQTDGPDIVEPSGE